jgi:putative hydrolase of the HAD superfamily
MKLAYSAIIFDLFGTLVPTYRHHDVLAQMALALGVDTREFIPAFYLETRNAGETGKVTVEENLRAICDRLGCAASGGQIQGAIAARQQFTRTSLAPRGDTLQTISDLKAMGFSIGLISDCCEVVSQLWDATSLAPHIDAAILSFRVGVRKPGRRIFALACEALSLELSRCLYVGDGGSHELTGALRAGMEAVLFLVEAESDLDPYRPDARTWTGPTIGSLTELVDALRAGRRPAARRS